WLRLRDVEASLRLAETHRPAVAVVTDRLDGADPLTLVARLSGLGIPVVYMHSGDDEAGEHAVAQGAVEHVPVERWGSASFHRLVARVVERTVLERRLRDQQAGLASHEQLLADVVSALPEGVCVLAADGRIRYLNQEAQALLGERAMEGRHILDALRPGRLFVRGTNGAYRVETLPLLKALRGVASTADDLEVELSPGNRRVIRMSANPLFGPEGHLIHALGTLQDVTEQRRLATQMETAQRMESVGQLAGGIAHDFNNMLTIIQTCSALATESLNPGHPAHKDLQQVMETSQRAGRLTRQLLAFSRRQVIKPVVLQVNEVISDLQHIIRRAAGERIAVGLELEHGLPPVRIDPGALEQVIVNLAVNAKDAMPQGGSLRIHTDSLQVEADYPQRAQVEVPIGPYARISVSDTGTGMSPEVLERIFEPFFTTKPKGKGTGLGLATCYGLIKQADGFIWAHSEEGVGTTFEVLLPRAAGSVSSIERRAESSVLGGRETILVAEDERPIRALAERILRKYGYTVLLARDGEDALTVAADHGQPIDLLLTDVVMPNMGGMELADRFRVLHPSTRILFMSGYPATDHGLPEGLDMLNKPFTPNDLGERIRLLLDEPRARART
ncbi:MAG: response regulator, partial [Myxococcales bacterium]|nr:response regulator [Myxococcales bacterium]